MRFSVMIPFKTFIHAYLYKLYNHVREPLQINISVPKQMKSSLIILQKHYENILTVTIENNFLTSTFDIIFGSYTNM